nr:F60 [uncultured bacterium]
MKQGYAIELEKRLKDRETLAGRITALVDYNEFVLKESIDTYRNFLEFFNFSMSSEAFRSEVSAFLSDVSEMIEVQITRKHGRREKAGAISAAAVTRFILSASFGISLQHLLDPKNRDVQAGFDIVKATAVTLL